jgi:branched-chain amino acid transport system substrate-binding protein
MQGMVKNQHAIAFVDNLTPLSTNAYVSYAEQAHIAVIGTDLVDPIDWSSVALFPQGAYVNNIATGTLKLAPIAGHRNVAMLYCQEANACANAYNVAQSTQQQAGVNLVYTARISLGGVDFTNNCIDANGAHADVMYVAADDATVGRVADQCAAQNYRPMMITSSLAVTNKAQQDSNLNGLTAAIQTFPWMVNSTPALAEYQQAIQTYYPSLIGASATSATWTAGKLAQLAGANLPANPTPSDFFNGLYAIKNNNLGGLTAPLTFNAGQPPAKASCYFVLKIVNGHWTAPNGANASC